MISELSIKNFKSILDAQIKLKPLTVLVGANGSGKSNLIKAIEFISLIAQQGLLRAVDQVGGFKSIVPKSIPSKMVSKTIININYRAILPQLKNYPKDKPPLGVTHSMELTSAKTESIRMLGESLLFDNPIAVGELLKNDFDEKKVDKNILNGTSYYKVIRGPGGGIKIDSDPLLTKDLDRFLYWLGLPMFKDSVKSKKSLMDLLKMFSIENSKGITNWKRRYQSFLDPNTVNYAGLARQATLFRNKINMTKRYDLLLNELRPEQLTGSTEAITTCGGNIPSVLRELKSSGGKSWKRLLKTMSIVAPHVSNIDSKRLRTGKEFVEFTEKIAARGIESWESSDGTLRALAILLALETHQGGGTILLEEPEQNLHPWAVREIIEHIREVIEERNIQVILTTHSPQVLDRVKSEEVLVVSRNIKSGTYFKTLDEIIPSKKLVMGDISRLWVKGLLGGIPSDVQ